MRTRTLNADVGESIGIHSFGNDEELIGIVDAVNVACAIHAGDPSVMDDVVRRAMAAGVAIGAHPGLPDMVGFGRRAMQLEADEARDLVRFQVGALMGFVAAHGGALEHVKPHGALFAMAATEPAIMRGVCEVAAQYGAKVYGLAGTAHESIAREYGVEFVAELYVDLDYDEDGRLLVQRRARPTEPAAAAARVADALRSGSVSSTSGSRIEVEFDSVCVHSDLPNAPDVARAVRAVIDGPSLS